MVELLQWVSEPAMQALVLLLSAHSPWPAQLVELEQWLSEVGTHLPSLRPQLPTAVQSEELLQSPSDPAPPVLVFLSRVQPPLRVQAPEPWQWPSSVGAPAVALFGPQDPARAGPYGVPSRVVEIDGLACKPCRTRDCPDTVCIDAIAPTRVFFAVEALLREVGAPLPASRATLLPENQRTAPPKIPQGG